LNFKKKFVKSIILKNTAFYYMVFLTQKIHSEKKLDRQYYCILVQNWCTYALNCTYSGVQKILQAPGQGVLMHH